MGSWCYGQVMSAASAQPSISPVADQSVSVIESHRGHPIRDSDGPTTGDVEQAGNVEGEEPDAISTGWALNISTHVGLRKGPAARTWREPDDAKILDAEGHDADPGRSVQ